jgi:predicted dehydrogenase
MSNPVKIGMLGGGMVNQIGHLPFYRADQRCEVVCVAEPRPSLVQALRGQFGADRVVEDYRAMLADPRIDAVVISVPRAATGPLTLEALEAGKHVLAEKPMAHSLEQARRLVDAARSRSLTYMVGYMKRYDPGIQAAKALFDEVMAEGRLGRLLLARFYDYSNAYAVAPPPHVRPKESRVQRFETWPTHPEWLPEAHRGVFAWFMNAASHDINLLRYFFPDNVEVVSAHCAADACVIATLNRDGDAIAFEVTKSLAGRWLEGAEFLFERGRITLTIPSPMATDRVSEVTIDDERRGVVGEQVATGRGWSFARQATGFVDALRGEAAPMTSGEDALADMELTEAVWRKMRSGGVL